jgi:hypothetical protein
MNKTLIAMLIVIQIGSVVLTAQAFPTPPHRFMGYVFDENGDLAADGTIVSALLNGNYYNTTVKNGKYGYVSETEEFQVQGSALDEGATIYFYINGSLTQKTATFHPFSVNDGLSINFNLSLDTTPLIINSVQISSLTTAQVTISWTTDKPSNSTINYGATHQLGSTKYDSNFLEDHSLTISNLQSETTYYFEVISYDYSENIARDNNSGNYYSFTTRAGSSPPSGGLPDSPSLPPSGNNVKNKPPVADVSGPYYGLVNKVIFFDASKSKDTDGYIVNYTWNLGDGTIISTTNVRTSHVYSNIGNYTIILTVADNNSSTNSTNTIAYISTNDTDGDGWSDKAEREYGTDPYNASEFPKDSDKDGIPDSADSDDDNDGLTDVEEYELGTNSTDDSDVIRILNDYGLFFLLDTNADAKLDKYYNQTSGLVTELFDAGNGAFLIDVNGDKTYDYVYNKNSGMIAPYQKESDIARKSFDLWILAVIIVMVVVIVISVIIFFFKKGGKP